MGGEVKPWEKKFEVQTEITAIQVMLPPSGIIFSQWYEFWENKRRTRWCDSQQQRFGKGPCLCPHASDPDDAAEVEAAVWERVALAKQGKACKPTTKLWLWVPSLPDIGSWLVTTHSRKAAERLQTTIAVMEVYRQQGIYLTATFRLIWEQTEVDGRLTWFPVPALELDDTLEALATGTAGATTLAGAITARTSNDDPKAITAGSALALPAPDPLKNPALTPADLGMKAATVTSRRDLMPIWLEVNNRRWQDKEFFPPLPETANTDEDDDVVEAETAVTLHPYLQDRWRQLHGTPMPDNPAPVAAAAEGDWPQEPPPDGDGQ